MFTEAESILKEAIVSTIPEEFQGLAAEMFDMDLAEVSGDPVPAVEPSGAVQPEESA